jgi:hypothetical protein
MAYISSENGTTVSLPAWAISPDFVEWNARLNLHAMMALLGIATLLGSDLWCSGCLMVLLGCHFCWHICNNHLKE